MPVPLFLSHMEAVVLYYFYFSTLYLLGITKCCIDTAWDLSSHTCYLFNSFNILTTIDCLILYLPMKKHYFLLQRTLQSLQVDLDGCMILMTDLIDYHHQAVALAFFEHKLLRGHLYKPIAL